MYKHGITKLYTTFKVNLSCLALGEKNKFIISISTSKVFTEILTVIELIKSGGSNKNYITKSFTSCYLFLLRRANQNT